jgi:hypothetical protein
MRPTVPVTGEKWIGHMDTPALIDHVALQIVNEADALVSRRLGELGLDAPHLVLAIAPDGAAIARSNVSSASLRAMAAALRASAMQAASPPRQRDAKS